MPEPLPQFDLDAIADPAVRAFVVLLLNLREQDLATIRALQEQNQRLRDEIARLKGEHGSPKPPRNATAPGGAATARSKNHSSEAERRKQTPRNPWKKGTKRDRIETDRSVACSWQGELPGGVVFQGYVTTVVQDLVIRRDNVAFRRESTGTRSLVLPTWRRCPPAMWRAKSSGRGSRKPRSLWSTRAI